MTQIPNEPVHAAGQPVVANVVHETTCEFSMNVPEPVCTCRKQAVTQEVVAPVVTEH